MADEKLVKHSQMKQLSTEPIKWIPDLEVSFFHSIKGHKPVGINRYFHMACILRKFKSTTGKSDVTSHHLWDHLSDMYNLDMLNELETLPFPNDATEFCLPEEFTNPEITASQPGSPATSTEDGPIAQRPTNLTVASLQSLSSGSTPENVPSPKRKRTRGPFLSSSSNPSSPAPATPGTKRRR